MISGAPGVSAISSPKIEVDFCKSKIGLKNTFKFSIVSVSRKCYTTKLSRKVLYLIKLPSVNIIMYIYIYAVMRSDMTKHDKCSNYTLEDTVYGGLSICFGAHDMCFRGYWLCSVGYYYDINFILENIYVRIVKLIGIPIGTSCALNTLVKSLNIIGSLNNN